jgi:SAM-dependent methyltransferase
VKAENSINYQALNELEIMSKALNYNNWIWQKIVPFIGNNIIEIGAGTGTFTTHLSNRNQVFATDNAVNCIEILRNRFRSKGNIIIEYFDITKPPDMQIWRHRTLDTAICLNVLEHIENDSLALQNINSLLVQGSKLILMVPAFQFAYGTIDILDNHFRRYSKKLLVDRLLNSGFTPINISYFNSLGLLAWYFTNKLVRDSSTSASKVKIYDRYFVPVLRILENIIPPPFGQSLIAIGKRS